jgi:hypothetical protein
MENTHGEDADERVSTVRRSIHKSKLYAWPSYAFIMLYYPMHLVHMKNEVFLNTGRV